MSLKKDYRFAEIIKDTKKYYNKFLILEPF